MEETVRFQVFIAIHSYTSALPSLVPNFKRRTSTIVEEPRLCPAGMHYLQDGHARQHSSDNC